jgi:hypothetical protein
MKGGPGGMGGMMGPGGPGMRGPNMADMGNMMKNQQGAMQKQMAGMGKMPGAGMGAPMAPGAAGAGASQVDNSPPDFHTPGTAVRSFLSALKAKDLDRLNESTALRASREAASTKNQELFQKIIDLNLSDSELDEIAKKLDGFDVVGENPPKSTGRVDVVIQKGTDRGGYIRRKVTVRHEKKGWGVLDIGGPQVFKTQGLSPTRTKAAGRNY